MRKNQRTQTEKTINPAPFWRDTNAKHKTFFITKNCQTILLKPEAQA